MLDASTGRNPPAPGSAVPGPYCTLPQPAPALDLARKLHLQAFAALIDARLGGPGMTGAVAMRLMAELSDIGTATLDTPNPTTPRLTRITMFGVSATGDTAYAILRNWQSAARMRLAERPVAPTLRGPFA
jgi:hypothetical protein